MAEPISKVTLKVMVDKKRNKVLFAEAGKDFVDVLLSFLTLPLGTIARLISKESNMEAVTFGSISSLYQSVSEGLLCSQSCRESLLRPRNSSGAYCRNLKVNIDIKEPLQSYFRGNENQDGFVKETSTFLILDNLCVMPSLFETSLNILQKHGINGIDDFDKQTLHLSKKEVVDLLKSTLVSKTPLSDLVFKKEQVLCTSSSMTPFQVCNGEEKEHCNEIVVKVVRRKSNKQLLFVEGEEDFADLVLNFLKFPIGGVLHMLHGISLLACIDNLYKSMTELSSDKYFRSRDIKELLTHPVVSIQPNLKNILPIHKSIIYEQFGYARRPMSFMVTNDLVVTPMSSIEGISCIERMKVPLNDVEEVVVNIGQKEYLSILKASLTSTHALSNGLNQYIGSGAVQADLSSNAASTDRPVKKPRRENEA